MPKPDKTNLSNDRDALGYDVRDACEEPLMRIAQAANTLCILSERVLRNDPTAADAVDLVHASLDHAVEALRNTLCLAGTDQGNAR